MRAVITRPARRARLTSWIDMMLSPPSSKKLSSMPTRSTPSTSANRPHRTSSCGVRGTPQQTATRHRGLRQRTAVQLAVRRQRKRIQHDDRRRHHVVRQLPRQRRTQRLRIRNAPRTRDNVADQTPLTLAPASALARAPASAPRNNRRLRDPGLRHKHSLDLAGSIRNPRSFSCASARPRNSSTPSERHRPRSPVRYIRLPATP